MCSNSCIDQLNSFFAFGRSFIGTWSWTLHFYSVYQAKRLRKYPYTFHWIFLILTKRFSIFPRGNLLNYTSVQNNLSAVILKHCDRLASSCENGFSSTGMVLFLGIDRYQNFYKFHLQDYSFIYSVSLPNTTYLYMQILLLIRKFVDITVFLLIILNCFLLGPTLDDFCDIVRWFQ